MTNHPMTPARVEALQAAMYDYSTHPKLGFACCSAHGVADAVPDVLAENRWLRARVTELEAASSRLTAVEMLVEEASDKCNDFVDTDRLIDALGLGADAPPGPRPTGLPVGLTGRARHDARVALETRRRAAAPPAPRRTGLPVGLTGRARHDARVALETGRRAADQNEAAELAEGRALLDAMRADHPAPCRVPDSPDCTCPVEYGIAVDNEYGQRVLDPSPDRAESLARLARCQQMWPNSRLVQRTISIINGEWTEVAP